MSEPCSPTKNPSAGIAFTQNEVRASVAAEAAGDVVPFEGTKVRVRQFLRRPVMGWFSIEGTFENVRQHLSDDISVSVVVNRRRSKGVLPRLLDAINARVAAGEVNHVLGDVHYVAWFLPRRRTMITVHDCVPLERARGLRRFVLWLMWYWWPMKRASRVTVVSEFTRQSLLKWVRYPQDKINVIPPPVSGHFTYMAPRPHCEWSRVLQIGSTPNKNVLRIVEALTGLNITLVMIGRISPPVRAALTRFGVRFENHSNVDDASLVEIYRNIDLLAFPSTYEGWGMPIIEAQATGRPVVTSNIASMPEAAGGAACLVDPFDVASIRAGIMRVLNDETYALGLISAGLANARKNDVKIIAGLYADVYRDISDQSKSKP